MAKKFLQRINNLRPVGANNRIKNIGYYEEIPGPDDTTIILEGEIPVIKNAWFEIGDAPGSQFIGTDGNGIPIQNVTWANYDEKMLRKEYPTEFTSVYDESRDSATILNSKYYYQQEVKSESKGKITPQILHNLRLATSYDEEYFSHVFNWPEEHILKTRTVGGFVKETITNTLVSPPTVTYNLYEVTATYSGNLELDSTDISLAHIDVNNDEEWSYEPLPLTNGRITDEELKDKLGNPVIYMGNGDSNSIFFYYDMPLGQSGTTNVIAIGDVINGYTISNVVNYITDFEVKRVVTKHSKKNDETNPFLQLDTILELEIGWTISGKGIRPGTTIIGLDYPKNRIYLSQSVSRKKIRSIRIKSESVNKVNRNTLHYATISGGSSNFVADGIYSVTRNGNSTGISIKVAAGKGIINRAAVTGVYSTYNRKEIEFTPVFFSETENCEKTYIEDSYGKYILGTAILSDSTLESKFFLVSPATRNAYLINGLFMITLKRPATQEEINLHVPTITSEIDLLTKMEELRSSLEQEEPILELFDDTCHDPIVIEYSQVYDTTENVSELIENTVNNFSSFSKVTSTLTGDVNVDLNCLNPNSNPSLEYNEVLSSFTEIINNSISNSSYMNPDYYENLVSGENSLLNTLNNATKVLFDSNPRNTQIENAPPEIEGEDSSGLRHIRTEFYRLPVSTDRVSYFISDVSVLKDDYLNSNIDLDPRTTVNTPKIVFRITPNYTATTSMIQNNPDIASILHTVNTRSGGFVNTITTAPGPIVLPPPVPGIIVTREWVSPTPKDYSDNIRYGEKSGSYPNQYIIATSVNIHPNLRDLDNRDFEEDGDINACDAFVYPQLLFAENISYQRDFHKTFQFRMEEISENITESITNRGNPHIDSPIRARLTSSLQDNDTFIEVDSTDDFISSGYLIIPKYVRKIYYTETGTKQIKFFYCGEEIIYYGSKTSTRFENIIRECFNTSKEFEITLSVSEIESNVRYKIVELGNTNWKAITGLDSVSVGTEFVPVNLSTSDSTGIVSIVGMTNDEFPDETPIGGVINSAVIRTTNSYDAGFSLAQYWPLELLS